MKFKKIIALPLCFVILFSLICPPVHADYVNTPQNWWDLMLHRVSNGSTLFGAQGYFNSVAGYFFGTICEASSDGYHHTDSLDGCKLGSDSHGEYAVATCKYCGETFNCYSSGLQRSYDAQVQELPASGITSAGQLKIVVPLPYAYVSWPDGSICRSYCNHTDKVGREPPFSVEWDENTHVCEIRPLIGGSLIYDSWVASHYYYETIYPITGYYTYGRSALVGY